MVNKTQVYAEALLQSLRRSPEKTDAIIAGFHAALKRRGDLKIAGRVIRAVDNALQHEAGETAEVRFARLPAEAARKSFEQFIQSRKLAVMTAVDPRLIGGITITIGNHFLIDASVAGKLKRLNTLLQ